MDDISCSIEHYEEGTNWDEHAERLQEYFELRKKKITTNRMKVSGLIKVVGQKTYSRLRDLSSPVQLNKRVYDEMVELLVKFYSPKRLVIAERFKF